MLTASRVVGSPGYPADEKDVAARAGRAYDRCNDPLGVARQAIAWSFPAIAPNFCDISMFPRS